jgi:hypothetical protein
MSGLTEEEAKTKWCPMARMVTRADNRPAGNRNLDYHPETLCIASSCMCWRWDHSLTVNNPTRTPGSGQTISKTTGYCGLAGGIR